MQPRSPGAVAHPALQTQPKLSKFTLRGLLTLPYRLCNPPPAVGKVRSFGLTPIFEVKLDDVLDRKHLPPLGLKDFEEWLLFVEQCPENLYFILWLREYTAKYNAWAATVRAREAKERAKESRDARKSSRAKAAATTRRANARRRSRLPEQRMCDVQEVDEDDEDADDLDVDLESAPQRTYRVSWAARSAYSPSLALFFSRARETFFSPASAYELIVPPDLLSPFFVGSATAPHEFASTSSSSSSTASSPISPAHHSPPAYAHLHPHPHPHSAFPYPLPHPDPAVFAPLQAHIEARLRLSLQRFVRAAYTNVGTFRATCGIAAGCVALAAGCVPPLALAFAEPDARSRWARLFAMPAMWLGLTLILASLRGVCLMVYVFGDFRQLRRFELERPPPPPLTTEKRMGGLLQVPAPAAMGDGNGRLSAFVLPTSMSMSMSATLSPTTTSTLTSTTTSTSSSSPYTPTAIALPAPIQVRALTAPPKISIRIPPARGHLLAPPSHHTHTHGAKAGSVVSGSGSGIGTDTSVSTSSETTLGSHRHGHRQTISISSARKADLRGALACAGDSSDEGEECGAGVKTRTRVHRVLDSDLDDDEEDDEEDDDEDEEDEDEEEDDNGIYISPLMPPPEEAAENDPAVFSAALALVAQAKAKAGREGAGAGVGEREREGAEAQQSGGPGANARSAEGGAGPEGEGEKEKMPSSIVTSANANANPSANPNSNVNVNPTANPNSNMNVNPNPNPTASFIPAFPYSAYQGTEEVDPWPVSACTSSSYEGGVRAVGSGAVAGAEAGKRPRSAKGGAEKEGGRERGLSSPVADRGPCWSVSTAKRTSRPGTGRSERSNRSSRSGAGLCARLGRGRGRSAGRDVEKGGDGDGDGDASDSALSGGEGEEDDDADAGLTKSGDEKEKREKEGAGRKLDGTATFPKLPMGPFDFDALPPVTRPPPQHLLHHLNHSHAHAHAQAQRSQTGVPDLEKGYSSGNGSGADGRRAPSLVGSVQTPSTLAALFALLPLPLSLRVPLPAFLRSRLRRLAPPAAHAHAFADPYTHTYNYTYAQQQQQQPGAHPPTAPHSHAYTYTYTCPASPAPASASAYGGLYGDAALYGGSSSSGGLGGNGGRKGWRRAYARVQRTPAFGPVTRVLSPVVSRAQWEIVVRAFVVAGLLTCAIEAALVALPGRW